MTEENLLVRFDSPEGGVTAFLNGFVLFGPEDIGANVSRVAPYLRRGANLFELVLDTPEASGRLVMRDLSAGGDPDDAPVLLDLDSTRTAPALQSSATFSVTNPVPVFEWTRAQPIGDIVQHRPPLYWLLADLADLLRSGPDGDLLELLSLKHAEMAQSVGMDTAEMDDGLLEGLAALRQVRGFDVEISTPPDFDPVVSSDGKIVNARRHSGGDTLKILDGIANPGFTVALARIDDVWRIVR